VALDPTSTFPSSCPPKQWVQFGDNIHGGAQGDSFGHSIALSSNGLTLAVGIPGNCQSPTCAGGIGSGAVRIYQRTGSSWIQQGSDINGEKYGEWSGSAVSISHDGKIIAIGAYKNDENGIEAGHVRVYEWNGSVWNQLGLDLDGVAGDEFGFSIDLSSDGSVLAVGAPSHDTYSGRARVFAWDGTDWNQRGLDLTSEGSGDTMGYSVALSNDGSILACGARLNTGDTGVKAGHVRVYGWNGSIWNQIGDDIDGEEAQDWSGNAVSLSGDGSIVAIGARFNDGSGFNAGNARVFWFNGTSWIQLGDSIGGGANDSFGYSLSLSSSGFILAIGTRANYAIAYEWDGSSWIQLGQQLLGMPDGDSYGFSVALSPEGLNFAVGLFGNSMNNGPPRSVRVFDYTS
jgi:hypothetical protein